MRRILSLLMIWLVTIAIVTSLFLRIETSQRLPYLLVEKGIHIELIQDSGVGFFPLKLLKKLKGSVLYNQMIVSGKSLCRPLGRNGLNRQPMTELPLFLLHHAFLFYDRA